MRTSKALNGGTRRSRRITLLSLVIALLVFTAASTAHAAGAPLYEIKATWGDTNLTPGDTKATTAEGQFVLQVRNLGDTAGAESLIIEDELPTGVLATEVNWPSPLSPTGLSEYCSGAGTRLVKCELPAGLLSSLVPPPGNTGTFWSPTGGYAMPIFIDVSVAKSASGEGTNTATVRGGGAARPASDVDGVPFNSEAAPFGIAPGSFVGDMFDAAFPFGEPTRQASDRPFELRVDFDITARTDVNNAPYQQIIDKTRYIAPSGSLRTVEAGLPLGTIGNPQAVPKCEPTVFAEVGALPNGSACPSDTQVGYLNVAIDDGWFEYGMGKLGKEPGVVSRVPIYNLAPPKGQVADFGFNAGPIQGHIYPILDPTDNYAIKTLTPNVPDIVQVRGSEVTFWGVPGDPAHDKFRWYPRQQTGGVVTGAPFGNAPIRPLLTDPMDCGQEKGGVRVRLDSYEHPGEFSPVAEGPPLNVTGCDDPRFRFEPAVSLLPSDLHAGAPTGLDVHLKVPQRNDEAANASELYASSGSVKGIATPPIKKTVVTLPEGMTISPSAGQGLGGCSLAQIGLGTNDPVTCPTNSQIGTLTLHTPVLPVDEPMEGRVYIASENDNPFKSFFAMYLVIEQPERGLLVKLPGRIDLDPVTGQITTTFDDLPQFPVSDVQLKFKGGARAALVNPSTCGRKTITAEFYSWQDPSTPHVSADSYDVTQKPDGSPCANTLAERGFAPRLSAGTVNPIGGGYSPFTFQITRTDDEQELSRLSVTLPPGLSANLTNVEKCSEAGIAQAEAPGRTGTEEIDSPSCPVGSQIGTVVVGTGVGATLLYVPGKVYFAGPYKGAPFSVIVISPAVVGPYDLGVVAVRSALSIDPLTAQATVTTDALPQIFKGVPVRIRDVRVTIDRQDFMFNPTDCTEKAVTGSATGEQGATAGLSDRFQAANCANLSFKPVFGASTSGKTSRASGASLNVSLSYPRGAFGKYTNIRSVKVSLPKQLPSRLTTLQKACPDSVFNANPAACPVGSRVGVAKATTPILPTSLEGPAYFVSHGGAKFPELVVVLQGDNVTVDLQGETFISSAGITSSTFHAIPDVPVDHFELKLPQGPGSALAANGNLCSLTRTITTRKRVARHTNGRTTHVLVSVKRTIPTTLAMPTSFTAQNGVVSHQNTAITVSGCPKHKTKKGTRASQRSGNRKARKK